MPKLITGILAHVDAGKTTLSEALLYTSGAIRNLGRVDSKNAFLDNNQIERERGITIFSKQAVLSDKITLIDTPGHVDFSAETERTLAVLDAAILLINASDGVQSHTRTLWSLLAQHKIPTLVFVNKMDMSGTNRFSVLKELKSALSENIINFDSDVFGNDDFFEQIATFDDSLTEKFLSGEKITNKEISFAINSRKIFPCVFGSALKLQNIDVLLNTLSLFFTPHQNEKSTLQENAPFGARVYKISKDKQNNRLTHLKVTSGVLHVKDFLGDEKANEIRIYSGEKYELQKEVNAGNVCTVTGLKSSFAGQGFGTENQNQNYKMESALIYSVILPDGIDTPKMLNILREVEEELPEIKVEFQSQTNQIEVYLMGEIQTQIIKQLVLDRYKIALDFGDGRIAYKETILEPVIGVGHYEPLRHYAEVHLKMSPLSRGSGLVFKSNLSVDVLDTNWQRLILTHLKEKTHVGVLTGSPITDIKIEVVAGRAHLKHTEGGDFRQSTYRAIRHGLMYAKSVLLEPLYNFELVIPEQCVGRAMNDIEKMHGKFTLTQNRAGFSTLNGTAPVSTMKNYTTEVRAYTKGQGNLSLSVCAYDLCHNQEDVIKEKNYNPNADLENPAGSVFCSHGAGFSVNWDEVNNYKHL